MGSSLFCLKDLEDLVGEWWNQRFEDRQWRGSKRYEICDLTKVEEGLFKWAPNLPIGERI
jgi:hypothetical protein